MTTDIPEDHQGTQPLALGSTEVLGGCRHSHTGSCSPDGVYLYVRCMDCWELLATSEEGNRRLDECPGYEPPKQGHGRACVHCGFDWWDHQHAAVHCGFDWWDHQHAA